MMKKIICHIGLILMILSCSKNIVPTTNVIPKDPLPNTVDKTDTLTVMAYNVLNYGDGCQGTNATLNSYLDTIIQYAQPDILSCEKMEAFSPASLAPTNLAALITNSLNTVFPNKYAYAMPTNQSGGVMNILLYNQQKLAYVKTEVLLASITDFDMYKLYYKDPNLSITQDTTFLYVVVNHTQSGSSSTTRDQQVIQEMQVLRNKFASFPNLINMGDFNTNNSSEDGYQAIISNANNTTKMSDPSFEPDGINHYPADWTTYPSSYASFLTTSTRRLSNVPNNCGTSGGAKSWYDHIFISPWLVNGSDYVSYIPHSYQTIGNDGNRVGVDINSISPAINVSAPANVINAMFEFSNKYPVEIKLLVTANKNASSPADPVERN